MATKSEKTLLKEAETRIEKLEKELENVKGTKDMYFKRTTEAELEIESVHCALDAMFVPRIVKSGYSEKTMTIASRLFAWQAGAKIEKQARDPDHVMTHLP
jgi:hypothetical protein